MYLFRCISSRSSVQELKIKIWGRLPQQTTPQNHFIMYIKYIKRRTARNALNLNGLRGGMSPRNPQNVAKKPPKCRQETPKRGTEPGALRGSNVVKKPPTGQRRPVPWLLFGLFLFVGFLSVRRVRPFPTVNRFPFRVRVLSERQEPRRLFPFKHSQQTRPVPGFVFLLVPA